MMGGLVGGMAPRLAPFLPLPSPVSAGLSRSDFTRTGAGFLLAPARISFPRPDTRIAFQMVTYGGMPVVVDALGIYAKVLEERGEPFPEG